MHKLSMKHTQEYSRFLQLLVLVFMLFLSGFTPFWVAKLTITPLGTLSLSFDPIWTPEVPKQLRQCRQTFPVKSHSCHRQTNEILPFSHMRMNSMWNPHDMVPPPTLMIICCIIDPVTASAVVTLLCSLHALRDPPSLYQDSFCTQLPPHATIREASPRR